MEIKKIFIGLFLITSCIVTCSPQNKKELRLMKKDYSALYVNHEVKTIFSDIIESINEGKTFQTENGIYLKSRGNQVLQILKGGVSRTPNLDEIYKIYFSNDLNRWISQLWIYNKGDKLVTVMYYSNSDYYVVDFFNEKYSISIYKDNIEKDLISRNSYQY